MRTSRPPLCNRFSISSSRYAVSLSSPKRDKHCALDLAYG
jgi:hypothetical protein